MAQNCGTGFSPATSGLTVEKEVKALTLRQGLGMGLDSKGKECQLGQEKPENKKGARGKAGLWGWGT